jgi:hypothetical protein
LTLDAAEGPTPSLMMEPAHQAIVAIAAMTPLALGLYIYGRWRRGDLRLSRDGLVVAGTICWSLVLAAAFAGPLAAPLLVPPLGLLVGGGYLWVSRPPSRFVQIWAFTAVGLGLLGLIVGALRLVLR